VTDPVTVDDVLALVTPDLARKILATRVEVADLDLKATGAMLALTETVMALHDLMGDLRRDPVALMGVYAALGVDFMGEQARHVGQMVAVVYGQADHVDPIHHEAFDTEAVNRLLLDIIGGGAAPTLKVVAP
jgi:hypothetical protein